MKKKWLRYSLTALIILLILFALSRFEAQSLLESVQRIPLWTVLVLFGLQIVTQLLISFQWYKIAKFSKACVSFRDMFYINCQGSVIDSITPGVKIGGEVARAVQISAMGNCSGEQAAAVVALQKLFSLSAFFFINLFALGYIAGQVALNIFLQLIIFGVLLLFLLLFLSIFLAPYKIKAYLKKRLHATAVRSKEKADATSASFAMRERGKRESGISRMLKVKSFFLAFLALLEQIIFLRKNTKTWVALLLLSLLIWLLYPLKMYLLTIQMQNSAHAVYIGAITYVSYLVAMIPIFPGGLGGFEGTMTGLLLAAGTEQSDALIITVLFRFVTFWFVMLFGLVFIAFHKIAARFAEKKTLKRPEE